MKKTIFKTALALAAVGAFMPAFSVDYFVVVPAKGKKPPPPKINIALSDAVLPGGVAGQPYSYDFVQHLQVTGDDALDLSQASWSATGLPEGLSMVGGALAGTPTAGSTGAVNISASYKGRSANRSYPLTVIQPLTIVQGAGYRTWSDGTYAASCNGYRNPASGAIYSGDVGDGIYRVQPPGQVPTNVYCDMTTDGGGWTLVVRVKSGTNAHVNAAAVNTLTAPNQATVAKLEDGFINALMTYNSTLRLTGEGSPSRTNYFKYYNTPWSAVGSARERAMSLTYTGSYSINTPLNAGHSGLNSFGAVGLADYLVYGPSVAEDGCRIAIAGPASWCGPGGSGVLYVK